MRTLAAAALVVGALAGCGGSDKPAAGTTTTRPSGSPLTSEDSARLAKMLFLNYSDGGAAVAVSFDYSADLSVRMVGAVDWTDHTGRLAITTTFADGRPPDRQNAIFEKDAVYEEATPDSVAEFEKGGRPGIEWIKRPPDTAQRPLDQVIDLLVSLAATRPDNPQLLAQGETTYDRREKVDGQAADVYATKGGAAYWLSVAEGRLVRFRGQLEGFTGPVLIDFSSPGEQSVEIPSGPTVIEAPNAPGG